ncbi:MAG: mechanosensitive ion channel [Chloroflexi bacterium]|nr:mechanosensitive ion channel [Chloroflexota bacterium]
MTVDQFQFWLNQNPFLTISAAVTAILLLFLFTRNVIARGLIYIASRTQTKVDDILVKHIKPLRLSLLAPFIAIYLFAYLIPEFQHYFEIGALFVILWISLLTLTSLLNAINEIYESRPNFNGVSIQSYLEILKIILLLVGAILSISLFSGESPVVLLTGLGALTAVLLLIFQNTILSLVASIQINTMDLIKEGDWIEVPSFEADGDVKNISLHSIKVQNFDMTTTVIPTHKIMDVAYKNWRGMREAGGRRIERSILIDMTSMKFCDENLLQELSKIDRIHEYLQKRMKEITDYKKQHADHYDSPLDGPQVTNTELFRVYIEAYLRHCDEIHHDELPFLVRSMALTQSGLPIEVYVFTKTTQWEEYEAIQSEIFDHLLAAAWHFDLRLFQEPTGLDFSSFAEKTRRISE